MIQEINELVGNKEFEKAKPLIETALKDSPNDVELLKLAGLVEVNLEEWVKAREYFETVVKYDSQDATSWFYLASCYENLGDFISAKNSYIKVIELRKEFVKAYKSLCIILLKLNDLQLAIDYARLGMKYENEDYMFDFIIGTAFMKAKDFEQALPVLVEADKKFPNNLAILNGIATCSVALKKFEDAIKVYERSIEIVPKSPMAYFNLGSVYQIMQNHEKACEFFQQALDIEEDETFIAALAMSEIKLKKYETALEHYKQLALMCPAKENYKYNIVTCYEALNQLETAIKLLEELIKINPKSLIAAQKLASLYIRTNQLAKAKNIYDNILLKNNVTTDIMHQYAILSSNLHDTETAERILKKVIKMNPEIPQAHKDLGIIYLNKRLFDYAEDEFKIAMKLAPDNFDILFEYACFLYSVSKNKEAEEYFTKILSMNPNDPIALMFNALNELVLNKLEEAKDSIMKSLKIEPHHEYIQFCAGRILYAKGEYEDAKMYLIKAVEQNPNIETQNTLGLTYFALKDYQQALNIFLNIYSKCPESVPILMQIAQCYEKLNNNDKALEYLNKLVDIFPENEEAHELIRKLS